MPHQLPPTPPEYVPGYAANRCSSTLPSEQASYAARNPVSNRRYEKGGFDYPDQYYPSSFNRSAHFAVYNNSNSMQPTKSLAIRDHNVPKPPNRFGMGSVPTLPPINSQPHPRVDEVMSQHHGYNDGRTRVDAQAKEEKPVGGVAAHLDYEMEQMSDYVSEMAQGMYDLYVSKICLADIDIMRSVQPGSSVSPQFRKYVLQILSSTRLPSSTILLGLYYLATRMRKLSADGKYKGSTGQVYRMLTTSLLLGSKFLDDNTFQNRSWSEVSSIPVNELNTLELEWLVAIDWNLHVDPHCPEGLMHWKSHWETWRARAEAKKSESFKLAPLDTSLRRQRSLKVPFSTDSTYPPQYKDSMYPANTTFDRQQQAFQPPVRFDQWFQARSFMEHSPPSASHSGPTTPEYYCSGAWGYSNPPPPYTARPVPITTPTFHTPSQPPSYQHTPYVSQYIWNGHSTGCGCLPCLRQQDPYFLGSQFSIQPVVS
ncbi:MAG: hypothetical protein M1834_002277 [Cirrosporium novae-zelandiae]|nr:MAG: hypothetical protein M1834_002277 [Cirrosporium novae-zelandiae]